MNWEAHLRLNYRREGERTVVHDRHSGPLRVLQSLHPEGPGICHNVVVHPPAGIAGGDQLLTELHLAAQSHALLTTPGATRFYRSLGAMAKQTVTARVDEGARLEWLPMETLCYRKAKAENHLRFELAPGAEMIGWDILGLGLPARGELFDEGSFTQQLEIPGVWLERGTIHGDDTRLLHSPLGWAGRSVLGTMWFAAGQALDPERREGLLSLAREHIGQAGQAIDAGATATHDQVAVVRVLAHRVEPAMNLFQSVWKAWRGLAWELSAQAPRVWGT
jgi:urease accessory protein